MPSSLLKLSPPILGFGTAQVFVSLLMLAVFSFGAVAVVVRSWSDLDTASKVMFGGAFLLVALVLIQMALRPSSLGFGFAAGLIILYFGIALSPTFRFSGREGFQDFLVFAVFLVVLTNFLYLALNVQETDVRLTYALAILSPVLLKIGRDRQVIFSAAYFCTWGIYAFSAWQELRASTLIIGVVLIFWAFIIAGNWKKRGVTVVGSSLALAGTWLLLIDKPIFLRSQVYVAGRDRLLADVQTSADGENSVLALFVGHGPGFSREALLDAGVRHGDLHSAFLLLAYDYGLAMLILTLFFLIAIVWKMYRRRISGFLVENFQTLLPVILVFGAFGALSFVADVISQAEMLLSFIVALTFLNDDRSLYRERPSKE